MRELNNNVAKGVAGARNNWKPTGVVIHNDAGSMTAEQYVEWLKKHNLAAGFAHYYIDRFTVFRAEDTFNMAWHTGHADGNANYVGYEICQSFSSSDKDFLANEQATFQQVAKDLIFWGLPANRNTIKLHNQFSPTACPHRSQELHGKGQACQDYFISQVLKFMEKPKPTPAKPKPKPKPKPTPAKPKPKPTPAKPKPNVDTITKGATVTVKKAINYDNNKPFHSSGQYKVTEVIGNRAVIEKSGVVVSAIHKSHLQLITGVLKPSTVNSAYYTSKPKYAIIKAKTGLYAKADIDFKGGHIGGTYGPGTSFKIVGMTHSKGGTPRFITESGYLLTANKKYVTATF